MVAAEGRARAIGNEPRYLSPRTIRSEAAIVPFLPGGGKPSRVREAGRKSQGQNEGAKRGAKRVRTIFLL
jgi:hypothetical protein